MKFCHWFSLVMLLCSAAFCAQLEKLVKEGEELQLTADAVEYDQNNGIAKAKGHVVFRYGNLTLEAAEATLNPETQEFTAQGDVVLSLDNGGGTWRSPSVSGNLETWEFHFGPYRLDSPVWHSGADGGDNTKERILTLNNGWISTCDLEKPHYKITAKTIVYHPDKTFTASNVRLSFWDIPVFWLPKLWGSTDGKSGLIFKPGYSGQKGAYLRVGMAKKVLGDTDASAYVDLMTKRGVGAGIEANRKVPQGEDDVFVYGVLDQDPSETEHGYSRRFRSRDERWRLHYYKLDKSDEGIETRLNLELLSDIDMLEDWFRHDYRRMEQPRNYLDTQVSLEDVSVGVTLRPRVNDFYTVVETLPEIRLEVPRLQVADSPFLYESSTKIGYYSLKWRNFDRTREEMLADEDYYDGEFYDDPDNYQSWRMHSQHFVYLPQAIGDFSVFTPRAGVAATYYSRSSKHRVTKNDIADMLDVDNPDHPYSTTLINSYDADGGEVLRLAYEVGAEWRGTAYSDWVEANWDWLNVHGLQHIAEPYINYTYMPEPSHDRDYLYYFDDLDRLEKQHFFRLGLDQRVLTHESTRLRPVLRLQSYMDFHCERGEESERHPGDFGNRLDVSPRDDLDIWTALLHDVGESHIHRGEAGIRLGKEDALNFALRYIYRDEHLSRSIYSLGSSLVDLTGESGYLKKRFESADVIRGELEIPLNSLTTLLLSAEYDFDESRFSEQLYQIRRQLHCWYMTAGFGWDYSDFETMVMFQLKAYPKVKLDLNF